MDTKKRSARNKQGLPPPLTPTKKQNYTIQIVFKRVNIWSALFSNLVTHYRLHQLALCHRYASN